MSNIIPAAADYAALCEKALGGKSATTRRTYEQTYTKWAAWCAAQGYNPLALASDVIMEFISDYDTTKTTRQRELAAMRQLLEELAIRTDDPRAKLELQLLRRQRVTRTDTGTERRHRALSSNEVLAVLGVWDGSSPLSRRNSALMWLLFSTAARASEVLALKWADIDPEYGILRIWHGKGDKARTVAIFGDGALDALEILYPDSRGFQHVFTPAATNGARFTQDKPMSYRTLYDVVAQTSTASGVEFTSHDARHTVLTELARQDVHVTEIQQQAGHANINTTARYVHAAAAVARRRAVRLGWE